MTTIRLRKPKLYYLKINEVISYVTNPKNEISNDLSIKDRIKDIIALYFIKVVTGFILIAVLKLLFNINNTAALAFIEKYHPLIVLFVGGLITPLFEEAIFRLSLTFKPIFLSISLGLLCLLVSSQILDVGILKLDETIILRYSIGMAAGILTYYISIKNRLGINNFWEIHFRWIYYFSAIAFGLVHFSNYDLNSNTVYLIPLLTLPHIIAGFLFGYVRIKHGFQYAIIFHSLNNMIALSVALVI